MPKYHQYGWRPDLPDARDFLYQAPASILVALPPAMDLRPQCPPVLNQGQLGSCTAHAIASAHQFDQMKQKAVQIIAPSPLYIYYNERMLEFTVLWDAGARIRDSVKAIAINGVCPETMWPYDITKFKRKPNRACYDFGKNHQAVKYQRLSPTLNQLKGCLAEGYPFVFGFTVYESFESTEVARSGQAPMPAPSERALGGHAVMATGYDDSTSRFLVKNSWGNRWGMQGYFTIPYDYLTNPRLSADFWTVRLVEV
jgi:C1A family cysteine protease